jgi:hypothetical protein
VKDLDVWAFFSPITGAKFPPRTRIVVDFGESTLGRDTTLGSHWRGRKVDVMGRDIAWFSGDAPSTAVRRYLSSKPTDSAWYLSRKPVIAIWPEAELGKVYWSLEECGG